MNTILYQQHDFPVLQNRMYDTEAEARDCQTGDILLMEDVQTGLIYNAAFRPELIDYDSRYQNEQAVSPLFQQHLETVASLVEKYIGRDRLVEVGCGKGFFMELLLARGFDITGFDPTYEGNNARIQCRQFSPGIIDQASGMILRHVLEHIQHPVEFLQSLKNANGGEGIIYIEVPCLDWILDHGAWFDIFYEHVNYFRLSDFSRMFGTVIDSGRLFGGQYIYAIADIKTLRMPQFDIRDKVGFPTSFTFSPTVEEGISAIWGGASKGVIFSLIKERMGSPVNFVIDINPAKQGLYLAGTGLQVHSPEAAIALLPRGSRVYVMNSNYTEEINELTNGKFDLIEVDHERL